MKTMEEIIRTRRTIRQFEQRELPKDFLKNLCDAGRLAPSGANLQPLRFISVLREENRKMLFPLTKWAGYLQGKLGKPDETTAPMGYILVLVDTEVSKMGDTDAGLAIENMLLCAWEKDVGSCILGAIDRDKIRAAFAIPEKFMIHSVLAFGYPAMKSSARDSEEIKYFYEGELLVVPKRPLSESLLSEF